MQEFETSQDETNGDIVDSDGNTAFVRLIELLRYAFKRIIVFVAFGPGIFGVLWLIGRIFKR